MQVENAITTVIMASVDREFFAITFLEKSKTNHIKLINIFLLLKF